MNVLPVLRGAAAAAAIVTPFLMGIRAKADVTSTFDTDKDGWTVFQNTPANFDWIAVGGNPAGHFGATDNTADWAYVQAPPKFLTPAEYDGTFSFDLRHDNLQQPAGFPGIFNVRVGLQGAGLTLISEGALPTLAWVNYSFDLNESSAAGWRKFSNLSQDYSPMAPQASEVEMRSVLDGLTRIVIATDYTLASTDSNVPQVDRTYIDNVRLSTQLFGDYNGNGTVDAPDYVLWRKGGPLLNDPTPGVQDADYTYWRSRFGATSGGSSVGSLAIVPEPLTIALSVFGVFCSTQFRRYRKGNTCSHPEHSR